MIQANTISLFFGNRPIFDELDFTIDETDRIALVGMNGSGKTTLLKAIVEPSTLDSGSITIHSRKKIAYMPQEVVLQSTFSVLEETYTAFFDAHRLEQELARLEAKLSHTPDTQAAERYAALIIELQALSPETLKAETKRMLMGLGFSPAQFDEPVSSLSGGWKMRIVLAKLLLQKADFYLFDEPTNHLDLQAKEWFINFLRDAEFGFLLICHERYALDELCTSVLELERGKGTWYNGNYSVYCAQKEHDLQILQSAAIQQQKEIRRKEETIARFRSGTKAKMAQSMERALDKIERIAMPQQLQKMHFNFPPVQQSGKLVIDIVNVAQRFGDKKIFQNVSCTIERGQKVALIAPNGVGKTTLFQLISGRLPVQEGSITFGYNVTHAIFAQNQLEILRENDTVLDNVYRLCSAATDEKIRGFLGTFLFTNEDVRKKVRVLSGGEKNRIGMACVLLQYTNTLLLDEPTNHLDIPSKEILLKALQAYTGTIIFVSHDRDFINDLATDIIELSAEGTQWFHGNFDAYTYQKAHRNATTAPTLQKVQQLQKTSGTPLHKSRTPSPDSKPDMKKYEAHITRLEEQIEKLYATPAAYGTPEFTRVQDKLTTLQKELHEIELAWEASFNNQ